MASRVVICQEHYEVLDAFFPVWPPALKHNSFHSDEPKSSDVYRSAFTLLQGKHTTGDCPPLPDGCKCLEPENDMLHHTLRAVLTRNKFLSILDVTARTVLSSEQHTKTLATLHPFYSGPELEILGFANLETVQEILIQKGLLEAGELRLLEEFDEAAWRALLVEIEDKNPQIALARLKISQSAGGAASDTSSVYSDAQEEPGASSNTAPNPHQAASAAAASETLETTPQNQLFEFLFGTVFKGQFESTIRFFVYNILPPVTSFTEKDGIYTLTFSSAQKTTLSDIIDPGIQNFNGGHVVIKEQVNFKVIDKPHPGIEFLEDDVVSACIWILVCWKNGSLKTFSINGDGNICLSTPSINLGPYEPEAIQATFKTTDWKTHVEAQESRWF